MSRRKIAIVGAGISGLAIGNELIKAHDVTIFEKENSAGGLIRCENVNGILYHKVGGHVFNTKNVDVANWFWNFFDKDKDFTFANRNSKIYLDEKLIGYPIENHLFELEPSVTKEIIDDLLKNIIYPRPLSKTFAEFLLNNFGKKLYNYYFKPYNEKIWNVPLNTIPLDWLEGKLPMPKIEDIIFQNIYRKVESEMVHSKFYYPINGGSQFIADKLARNINIIYCDNVFSIILKKNKFIINNQSAFDTIVYTGDVRNLPSILHTKTKIDFFDVADLVSNATTNVLCEIDDLPYSWIYLPEKDYLAHRIIMTGNFSTNNNGNSNRKTCTIEFAGIISDNIILEQLSKLPYNINPIKIHKKENSYIIHKKNSNLLISNIKNQLEPINFFLLGRFAEWKYYNMDTAIEAALLLKNKIL